MADLTRTKCGRIQRMEKYMFNSATLTSYYKGCYKSLFSPFVRKTCDFVQNSMGYHSEKASHPKKFLTLKNIIDEYEEGHSFGADRDV